MTGPINHYERALVPEFLTKQTIETIPLDIPHYISPGERNDHTDPAIFTLPNGTLVMPRAHCIDKDDTDPGFLASKVGVMRIALMDRRTYAVRTAYVADLRFIEDNALVDKDTNARIVEHSEGMSTVQEALDTITFEAFIATEQGEVLEDGMMPATFYGHPDFYDHLELLREQSDLYFARFLHDMEAPDIESDGDEKEPETHEEQDVTVTPAQASPSIDTPFLKPGISE